MDIDIYQLGDDFDTYTEAFEFLQRHLALVSLADDDDDDEDAKVNAALDHLAIGMAIEWVQAACEWCDQSGRGARS